MGNIGNMDAEKVIAGWKLLNAYGIIEIARGFAINCHRDAPAKILAPCAFSFQDGIGQSICFPKRLGAEIDRQSKLMVDDFIFDSGILWASQYFYNFPLWNLIPAGRQRDSRHHNLSILSAFV
jgi:hypothetical protein